MNTEPQTSSPRFPFFRRGLRAVFSRKMLYAVVVLITLVALGYAVENFRGARAWEQYRKAAEARGVKLDFAAYVPPPIPDAENGANTPWVQSWFPKPRPFDQDGFWPPLKTLAENTISNPKPDGRRHLTDLVAWKEALEFASTNATKKSSMKFSAHQRNPAERAAAAAAVLGYLKIYQPTLDELRAASTRPRIRYPVDYRFDEPFSILLPHLAKIKGTVQELSLQSCAELAAGKTEEAFHDVQLMFWLTESLRDELFLISQLVRIACLQITTQAIWEGIAQHKWTDAQLGTLEERLGKFELFASIEKSMNVERAAGIATIERLRTHGGMETITDDGEQTPPYASFLVTRLAPRGWFRMEAANYGRMMDASLEGVLDLGRRTIDVKRLEANNRELDSQLKGGFATFAGHRIFGKLLLPALRKVSRKFVLAQNTAEEAAVACALERHRLAHGKLPETLEALVPRFIARLPHDPINGEALKYEREGDTDFVLSSVGWVESDAADSGGSKPPSKRIEWEWRSAP